MVNQVEEVIEEDNNEIAEERYVAPVQFAGTSSEDTDDWYRHFQN